MKAIPLISRLAVAAVLTLSVAASWAQGNIGLKIVKSYPLPKPVTFTVRDQVPLIAPVRATHTRISENEKMPTWLPTTPPNNLPVGGMLNETRGYTPSIVFDGPGFADGWPPDCDCAVGPDHVILVVNTVIGIYDKKTGKKLFQSEMDGAGFFSGIGVDAEVISDPKCLYDKVSGHWFVHIIEVNFTKKTSNQLVAVSNTSDPMGTWKKYRLNSAITVGGNDLWLDYPEIAVTNDGFAWTGNMFGFTNGFSTAIFATSKAALISGTAGKVTVFSDDNGFTINVNRNFDATSKNMYAVGSSNNSELKLYSITGFTGTPTVQTTTVTVPTFTRPNRDATGPNGHVMQGFKDGRIFTSAYRNGSVYAAHNIMTGNTIGIRWYDVSLNGWPASGTPSLHQSGNISGGTADVHMPAIQVNKFGAISVVYTRSSPSLEAQVVYSARKKSDPLGSMGQPVLVASSKANSGPQPANRWGDYFGLALDPTDESTFWGFGETAASNGLWATVAGSWRISDPAFLQLFSPTTATVVTGRAIAGTVSSLAALDKSTYDVQSAPISGLGQVAAFEAVYNTSLVPGKIDSISIRPNSSAPATGTQQIYLWNWAASRYDLVVSKTANQNDEIALGDGTKASIYVSSTKQVKALFRMVVPLVNRVQPPSYTLKTDLLQFVGLPTTD